ncbi:MAG TPA: hypothetical protein VNO21_01985 [Polyangiaceae bacterium]|nr:hypothetical protein [Polyangiaceae bacterium]
MIAGRRPHGRVIALSFLAFVLVLASLGLFAACGGGGASTGADDNATVDDEGGTVSDASGGPDFDAIDFVPDGAMSPDGGPRDDCQGQPESHQWDPSDPLARCCGGSPVLTNTNTNCGVCGIGCNEANGESCQEFNGHWFCRGCVVNTGCWSGCCATSYSPPSCSPADCNGHCRDMICPTGSHCVDGSDTSDYCAY